MLVQVYPVGVGFYVQMIMMSMSMQVYHNIRASHWELTFFQRLPVVQGWLPCLWRCLASSIWQYIVQLLMDCIWSALIMEVKTSATCTQSRQHVWSTDDDGSDVKVEHERHH